MIMRYFRHWLEDLNKIIGGTLLIQTKNFYQQNPPGTLKVVWTLLNPTEFAQKIDLLLKVPDVAPSTAEKMTSLQICWIKKLTPRTLQTFWDRQLCFYVKKLFVSEKTQRSELCHFFIEDLCHQIFLASNSNLCTRGKIWWHKSPMKNDKVNFSVFFH